MAELQQIVELWRAARAAGEEVCLATVVRVEGSSYRKPGARMLLTRGGRRAGTVSGGCLEAEVTKKAWWLTANGPTIERYSSFFDDDSPAPYGLGCGGIVHILLERGPAAHAILNAMEAALFARRRFATVTDTNTSATLLVKDAAGDTLYASKPGQPPALARLAEQALSESRSFYTGLHESAEPELFVECFAPPPALTIFGAGDDARPLADFAQRLGWRVTIADGRSHLANAHRFPQADRILVLDYQQADPLTPLAADAEDAFVLLTHSYEQDGALLKALLPHQPRYIGMLGPLRRTARLLEDLGIHRENWPQNLYAPVGFDIGAHTPEIIALSIIAEIAAVLNGREGKSLKTRIDQPAACAAPNA